MKKSLLAAGVASLAVAAVPVLGVFAETTQFTDQVQVIIDRGCTFEVTDASNATTDLTDPRTFSKNVTLGEVVIFGSESGDQASSPVQNIKVACNDDARSGEGWTISAVGSQETVVNGMTPATSTHTTIASDSAHTAETSGGTSYWSYRINVTGGQTSYGATTQQGAVKTWYQVPSTDQTVATGTPSKDTDASFAPEYRVYIGTNQEADTYTGKVTYTLSDTMSN